MGKSIRVSDEVFKRLQEEAAARGLQFASADNVIRAILNMELAGRKTGG